MEGFESRDVLVERREVSREPALEAGGQVFLPPHLPQAEHAVLTAQELHAHTHTHTKQTTANCEFSVHTNVKEQNSDLVQASCPDV